MIEARMAALSAWTVKKLEAADAPLWIRLWIVRGATVPDKEARASLALMLVRSSADDTWRWPSYADCAAAWWFYRRWPGLRPVDISADVYDAVIARAAAAKGRRLRPTDEAAAILEPWVLTKKDPLVLARRDPLRDHKVQIGDGAAVRAQPAGRRRRAPVAEAYGRGRVAGGGGRVRPPASGRCRSEVVVGAARGVAWVG